MYRIYHPNLVPVTNKYLAQKQFIKDRKDLKNNVRFFFYFHSNLFIILDRLKMHMV
jgi:hypothetical protein